MNVRVDNVNLSFREKLSYIQNSNEYNKVLFKLWGVCILILSFGTYNLHLTERKCLDVLEKNGECIFSRKIRRVLPDLVKTTFVNVLSIEDSSENNSGNESLVDEASSEKEKINRQRITEETSELEMFTYARVRRGADEFLNGFLESDEKKRCSYQCKFKKLYAHAIENCDHYLVRELVLFALEHSDLIPSKLLSFSSLPQVERDNYISALLQNKEAYSEELFHHIFIENKLINEQIVFNYDSNSSETPLCLSILHKNSNALSFFLRENAFVSARAQNNNNLLHMLVKYYRKDDFEQQYESLMERMLEEGCANNENLDDHIAKALIFINVNAVKFLLNERKEIKGEGYLKSCMVSTGVSLFEQACRSEYHYAYAQYHEVEKHYETIYEFERNRTELIRFLICDKRVSSNINYQIIDILSDHKDLDYSCIKLILNYNIRFGINVLELLSILSKLMEKNNQKSRLKELHDDLYKRYGKPIKTKKTPECSVYGPNMRINKLYSSDENNTKRPENDLYDYCLYDRKDDSEELIKLCIAVDKVVCDYGDKSSKKQLIIKVNRFGDPVFLGYAPIHHLCNNGRYNSAISMLKRYPYTNVKSYQTPYNLLHCLAVSKVSYQQQRNQDLDRLVEHIIIRCKVSPYETCRTREANVIKNVWELVIESENLGLLESLLKYSSRVPNEDWIRTNSSSVETPIRKEMDRMINKRSKELKLKEIE